MLAHSHLRRRGRAHTNKRRKKFEGEKLLCVERALEFGKLFSYTRKNSLSLTSLIVMLGALLRNVFLCCFFVVGNLVTLHIRNVKDAKI
jgi:hypothetical protein